MIVWNMSNPGGAVQISNKQVSITVDNDNNHNVVDFTPDPLSWSSSSFTTTGHYGSRTAGGRTLTGFNQPITLRAAISSNGGNGQMNAAGCHLFRNGSSIGSFEWIMAGTGGSVSGTFNAGDTIDIFVDMQSWSAFRATHNCTVTIYNDSAGGAVVGSWSVAGTVFSNKPNA